MLFSVLPSLFLLVFFVLTEFSLRWFWPSLRRPFVVPTVVGGVELLQINRGYLAKYFPPSVPLLPELKPSLFRKQKQKNTFRIVCLGESSMFGTPYQMTANIPGILRKQLRHLYPDRDFEVLNLGASAINSNVMADLAKHILDIEPDLVLLYAGHNEFYGPDGIGASYLEKRLPWLSSFKYATKELSLVALLERILVPGKEQYATHEYNLMRQVSQEFKVSLKSDDAVRIFDVYEVNLRTIVTLFQEHHVPVIVSDVTSNLLFPPFASDTLANFPEIINALKSAELLESRGKAQEALQQLLQIRSADSTNPALNYLRGRIKLRQKDIPAARFYLTLAKDHDLLKFRAPQRTNEITRSVCDNLHVPFISSASLFTSISPAGIPGNDFFWEHLHPTARGYYEIANLYLRKILELKLIDSQPAPALTRLLPFNVDSLSFAWLDLAYADLSMQNLTRQWPFENYTVTPVVLGQNVDPAIKDIAAQVYNLRMGWEEGCLKSAFRFQALGQLRTAARTYDAMLEENPYDFYVHYLLGGIQRDAGELEKAIQNFRSSIVLKPAYALSRIDLGLLEVNQGNIDEAIDLLSSALPLTTSQQMETARATIFYGLAASYANKGDFEKALQSINQSLTLASDYAPAQKLKAELDRYRKLNNLKH